ncbi:MAG: TolC family protein [Planctomycetaceae bacterium]
MDWQTVRHASLTILITAIVGCQSTSHTVQRGQSADVASRVAIADRDALPVMELSQNDPAVDATASAASGGGVNDSFSSERRILVTTVSLSDTSPKQQSDRSADTIPTEPKSEGEPSRNDSDSGSATAVNEPDVPSLPESTDMQSAEASSVAGSRTNDAATTRVVSLQDVIQSVHLSYPLVEAAYLERTITNGNQVSAWGEFDTKLKATSENGPLGFYETYRNSAGFTSPIYHGGEFFGGYRNGGGSFQPWYQERETNDGGEFKAGVRVPLIRDRDIDARRAALWRATYDQQIANPVIHANLVGFGREAGLAYWKWVAAGQKYRLGQQWLDLAETRNESVKRRVKLGDLDPPELVDNERAIAKRQAKLSDSRNELLQAAIKLSLFLRDDNGIPYVPSLDELPAFPQLRDITLESIDIDIQQAQQARPELAALNLQLRQLQVDYAEACNMTRPGLDAQLVGSQDVGEPTSSKRDKSEFELEAALFFEVPVQRRKGLGKMQAVQGKIAQVTAKRRMVQDKVSAEVQTAYASLIQSRLEVLSARRAVRLATQMAEIEGRKFELGESDLLKVALREQYALEAAEEEVSATYSHFAAFSDYAATLAFDRPSIEMLPADETNAATP